MRTTKCLTHIQPNEIYLECGGGGGGGLINLVSVQYGHQEMTLDDRISCGYQEGGACLRPLGELGLVRSVCMSLSQCYFSVSIVYLEACQRDSNFVQVEYQCIPGKWMQPSSVYDGLAVEYCCIRSYLDFSKNTLNGLLFPVTMNYKKYIR